MSEHPMDDSERLTWLEDQLWNAWELDCLMDGRPGAYQLALGKLSAGGVLFEADSLREVIDKAAAWGEEQERTEVGNA